MPPVLKVGLIVLVIGLYFGGAYAYGVNTGQSLRVRKGQSRGLISQAQDKAAFETNQRFLLQWGSGCLGVGAILTVAGLIKKSREEKTE